MCVYQVRNQNKSRFIHACMLRSILFLFALYDTIRYNPLRGPSSSSCGKLWPSAKVFCIAVLAHLGNLLVCSSNPGNF